MPEHTPQTSSPLALLAPSYRSLRPLGSIAELRSSSEPLQGAAVVWLMDRGHWPRTYRSIRNRPGGVALIAVLPPADDLGPVRELLAMTEQCRPHSILPHHDEPSPEELVAVLRRPPADLPGEVMDYVSWRGIRVDHEARHLIRRTVALSAELKTVSGLARALYMSRRALGRRFLKCGLPVPSHWLHFSRVLRASIELQNSDRSLFQVAGEYGYTDGFSLSNQMKRLTGLRPSTARECVGWEWIVEAWLRTEAADGGLDIPLDDPVPPRSRDASSERGDDWRRTRARRGDRRAAAEG